jgi:hypothetical protein
MVEVEIEEDMFYHRDTEVTEEGKSEYWNNGIMKY